MIDLPLKFPTKAIADSNFIPSSEVFTWDAVSELNTGAEYFVNITVVGTVPTNLLSYVIPFQVAPKRVFFRELKGGNI